MSNFKAVLTEDYKKYKKPAIERRRTWAYGLLGDCCAHCGSTGRLEFDHIDPSTVSFRIGSNLLARLDTLIEELNKCQLLCHPCHVVKTREDRTRRTGQPYRTLEHGTLTGYMHYHCRCRPCTDANAAYYRVYMRKRRAVL